MKNTLKKSWKPLILFSLICSLTLCMMGCGGKQTTPAASEETSISEISQTENSAEGNSREDASLDELSAEGSIDEEAAYEEISDEPSESTEDIDTTASATPVSDATTLVVVFSVTGNTRPLAKYAAEYLNADFFEIEAVEPYTDEDIDYGNSSSRTSIEQNDPSSRPEIANFIPNMDQYDTIILGYPIWWGQAPRIIDTFLESYDFSGKTIVPFCTSASSGIGSSDTNLHAFTDDSTNWIEGKRFAIGTDQDAFLDWLSRVLKKS